MQLQYVTNWPVIIVVLQNGVFLSDFFADLDDLFLLLLTEAL